MNARVRTLMSALRGPRLFLAILVGVALLLAFGRLLTAAYVEILWHTGTGYGSIFWKRIIWGWGTRIVAGLAVGLLVFFNLRLAAQTLGGIQIRRRFGNLEISEQLPKQYVFWALIAAGSMLGLWFGASVPLNVGHRVLLLTEAVGWGLTEPIHGRDPGFYVYWLPVFEIALLYALTAIFLVFTLATAGYAATGALNWRRGRIDAHPLARLHLGAIIASFLLLLAAQLFVGRYGLLVSGTSAVQGIFGYTDAQARLPALQTLAVITLAASVGCVWGSWKGRAGLVIASITSVILGSLVIREAYPALIQSFRVEPNELVREEPYIEHNLEFTRRGFALDALDRRDFTFDADQEVDWGFVGRQFEGLPVWNRSALLPTFTELHAGFDYYQFTDVTFDRYAGENGPVPVAIAVREVNGGGIPDRAWQNVYLRERFIAGQGAVASLAARRAEGGRAEMLVEGIPPARALQAPASPNLDIRRPHVFFGSASQAPYAVVTPAADQFRAPDGGMGQPGVDFPNGIAVGSTFRKALLAWRFSEPNLLFSSEVLSDSRLIFRRRVRDRVAAIAPFLDYSATAYPVIADGRVVWVLEAFTISGHFPLASSAEPGSFRARTSYVRNSFKVIVDAVTGDVDFYRVPIEDPLADSYEAAYPGLFKPMSELAPELRDHLRYSRQLFDVQAGMLLQYHQQSPAGFHGQQDVWAESEEQAAGTNPIAYRAEYGIYQLPGEPESRFHLSTVFVPLGRQNLTAMLVGRTGQGGTPELILIDVPVEDQAVRGPRQVEALIEQDPAISQQLSLWRTGGSSVWTGHLHLIPVGNRFFYMEPIFLAAEADAIPELRRFVVSDGAGVAMTETLEEAIATLAGAPTAPIAVADVAPVPQTEDPGEWPQAALDLLEEAEARARAGDWEGYGAALDQLRALLQSLSGAGGTR